MSGGARDGELGAVERALRALPRPDPPASLRARVLGAAQREAAAGRRRRDNGLIAAAAAAVLWFTVAWSASRATDFSLNPPRDAAQAARLVRQLQELAPELSEAEARRQAALLLAAS